MPKVRINLNVHSFYQIWCIIIKPAINGGSDPWNPLVACLDGGTDRWRSHEWFCNQRGMVGWSINHGDTSIMKRLVENSNMETWHQLWCRQWCCSMYGCSFLAGHGCDVWMSTNHFIQIKWIILKLRIVDLKQIGNGGLQKKNHTGWSSLGFSEDHCKVWDDSLQYATAVRTFVLFPTRNRLWLLSFQW